MQSISEMPQPVPVGPVESSEKRIKAASPQNYDYFTQGFQIPPEEKAIRDRLLTHIPTLKTKTYRDSLFKIVSSLSQLDSFTDNIESKVDRLLQAQQSTFVDSYRNHITKIQKEFNRLHSQIGQLQEKVKYYQNQGKMSSLVKKVFLLEQQSSKLFKTMVSKDKKIRDQQRTITVLMKQMKNLQQTVKFNARQKSQVLLTQQYQRNNSDQQQKGVNDFQIFATQVRKKHHSISHHQQQQRSSTKPFQYFHSHKSVTVDLAQNNDFLSHNPSNPKSKITSNNEQSTFKQLTNNNEQSIFKQNKRLKIKNKQLLAQQTKMVDAKGETQQFFVRCIQDLKKEIKIRKKMQYCSFQDFKKQDKLLLMIKILSNNQILSYLYDRIFLKRTQASHQSKNQVQTSKASKLPKISFNLGYQKDPQK